ncbi:MAG: hypothetical protein M5R40_02690 [Anaerolineae bacterium]|nr:hypothetical protein [Anaerolineae bacterium]
MTTADREERNRLPRLNLRALIYRYDDPVFVMLRHWLDGRNPIFRQEVVRAVPRISFKGTPFDSRGARTFFRFVGDWASGIGCLLAPLFLLAPFIPWLWRVPTVLSAAPTVAREIEGRTWLTLRSTPFSTREILEALHAAGTYRVAQIWAYVTSMRLAVVGILAMMVIIMTWFPGRSSVRFGVLDWLAYLLAGFYFLAEPLIDTAVDGAVGIFAATLSKTQLTAVINGVLMRVILWSFQVLALLVVLPVTNNLLPANQASNVPTLMLLGPAYTLALGFPAEAAIVLILVTLVFRVVWLRLLMAITVWRAETI